MQPDAVTLEVRALEALDLEGVRAAWRARYGAPPKLRSVELMKRLLAWRIQSEAFGGLDAQVRRKLRSAGSRQERSLTPGTKVAREWKGVTHEVAILPDGFGFEGRTYDSLSAVAREITGARWNGPRFFGLRSDADGK
jgi:hypothetical protein